MSEDSSGFDPSRKSWPLCGYAPGSYFCRCHQCRKQFEGDKRSLECLDCAAASARHLIQRGNAAQAAGIHLHDTLRLWSEFGGPVLPPQVEQAMDHLFGALRDRDGSPEVSR